MIGATSPQEAAVGLCNLAAQVNKGGRHVHLVNAYTLALADTSSVLKEALSGDAINLPDGKPLTWVSLLKGQRPTLRQVRGPQLFLDVFDLGRSVGLRHYLLGSTPAVLQRLESKLRSRFPGVRIVGSESPPFRALTAREFEASAERIIDSGAQVVWLGLGTPKQDYEAARLCAATSTTVVAVGAAFDFAAGTKVQAPRWLRTIGLEWAHRLATEPRRLWRRYLFGNLRFLFAVARDRGEQ